MNKFRVNRYAGYHYIIYDRKTKEIFAGSNDDDEARELLRRLRTRKEIFITAWSEEFHRYI